MNDILNLEKSVSLKRTEYNGHIPSAFDGKVLYINTA